VLFSDVPFPLPLFTSPLAAQPLTILSWSVALDASAEGTTPFWHQGNAATFACQEKREPELHRAFLLPMCSLVKCILDRPMHAGFIAMASRDWKRVRS